MEKITTVGVDLAKQVMAVHGVGAQGSMVVLRGNLAPRGAILKQSAESIKALRDDTALSREDRRSKLMALRKSTEQQIHALLTPEQQAEFVAEQPDVFVPIAGGWGRMGMTHIRLAEANEDLLAGALRAAWRLRIEKNARAGRNKRPSAVRASRTARS